MCRISLEEILAVERLHEDSFKMKNMFQIVQPQRALYVQAGNCVEEKEWIDILTKICHTNSNRLERYHPSAYINGHWLWYCNFSFLNLFDGRKNSNFHTPVGKKKVHGNFNGNSYGGDF